MRIRQDGKSSRLLVLLTWVVPLALLLLSGCVSLAKSFPDNHYYALDVTRQGEPGVPVPATFEDCLSRLVLKAKSLSIVRATHATNQTFTMHGLSHPARC